MFYLTIHDAAGNRIDDDQDCPLTEEQLDAFLANCEAVTIPGTCGAPFYRNGDQIVSYVEFAA